MEPTKEQQNPEPQESASTSTETTPLIQKNGTENMEGGDSETVVKGGLSVKQTALLIAGGMAGPGVLSLPRVLVRTGWLGVPVIVATCLAAAFSGKRLGDCWSILEERNESLRARRRNPYAIIVNAALGPTWSVAASMCILVTLFGAGVVYLLMAAQIIGEVFLTLAPTISYCMWYLFVTLAITPYKFFGTPKDFHFIGTVAFLSTLVACVLYFIQMMVDVKPFPIFRYGIHGFQEVFLAFGTVLFAFGGGSIFPTIQNDMADRSKFYKSIDISFTAILGLYLPIAVAGYAVYGESAAPNIALSLSPTALALAGNVFMAIHLLSAFVIMINPVCQEMEEMYKVPRDSMGWRIIVRGSIMLGILFVGASIPRFYTILALVGASTVALLTFVLPSYCYLQLTQQPNHSSGSNSTVVPGESGNPIANQKWVTTACWAIVVAGVVGGVAATYSAVAAVFSTAQATPCFLR